ncbi:uncharacterized protein B0P05DRAFT_462606 [Gilbertella persicaria]|uniref:uncharacterized protein n=1 Tax=Gilbertella persicaria TaxID=101096 RepID=UPI00221E79DE|nr:uncharacterized protein B0P05DRAFT_462606 [Gilbertella persicaria]KAI8092170.1 hypothetical protein B0P05DRAFT_462606 [Gilbertella persicaria]
MIISINFDYYFRGSISFTLVSDQICNIMIRAQLFVDYYIITYCDQAIDKRVFTQNFWHCIKQLVLKKIPKNRKVMSDDCLAFWESFSSRYNLTYEITSISGYSHCLTTTCAETAAVYTNNIVECFESRMKTYLVHDIMKLFIFKITLPFCI